MNARRIRSFIPRKRLRGERRTGKGKQVDSRIGVPGSTSNDTTVVVVVVVFARSYVFARSAFRPSSPPASSPLSLSLSPTLVSSVILVVPLSAGVRAKAEPRERGGEKKRGGKRDRGRSPQTPAIRRRERRTKDGLARPTRTRRGGNPGPGWDRWRKGRTRDAKGDAKETTKRSNAKMAPERDTAARNSRQFRAKLLGAGRARTLASRRRVAPLRPAYLM